MTIHHIPTRSRLIAPGGPVTLALRHMRDAERLPDSVVRFPDDRGPASLPALREGLRRQIEADLQRVERMIASLDLLDLFEGHEDAEDGGDDELTGDEEPSLGSIEETAGKRSQEHWGAGSADDGEAGDDTGIGDRAGAAEQALRFLKTGRSLARMQVAR